MINRVELLKVSVAYKYKDASTTGVAMTVKGSKAARVLPSRC